MALFSGFISSILSLLTAINILSVSAIWLFSPVLFDLYYRYRRRNLSRQKSPVINPIFHYFLSSSCWSFSQVYGPVAWHNGTMMSNEAITDSAYGGLYRLYRSGWSITITSFLRLFINIYMNLEIHENINKSACVFVRVSVNVLYDT